LTNDAAPAETGVLATRRAARFARFIGLALSLAVSTSTVRGQAALRDPSTSWRRAWVGGLHVFGPAKGSVALGAGVRREWSSRSRLFFAVVEPGITGQRISIGYGETVGTSAGGWSVRGSLLQLTSEPARRTLAGVDIQIIPAFCLGSRIGAFRAVKPAGNGTGVLFADLSLCL
jgi:hypothetical protein